MNRPRLSLSALACIAFASCTPTWTTAAYATEAGAIGALACDGGTTQQFMRESDYIETNPILGQQPSNGAVWTYLGAIALGTIAANRFLPKKAAVLLNLVVMSVEVKSTIHNMGYGTSVCGIGQGGPWGTNNVDARKP